ncbi:putative beta-D-xylosidase 7 [Acorus calamus]|uniref:Beta-D-xylosidase 7 n=1 Tax=Acorus calamus TaxID=4465 RepID=A0AAV9DMG5_ACOCL|nr:putative beta-D-xylosidase 7 [Acorus calamus]
MSPLLHLILFSLLLTTPVEPTDPPFSCGDPTSSCFCNPSLPIAVRSSDLVSRLTLDEKISQLGNTAPAIPRLGVPAYQWWSESLHGVADSGPGINFNGPIHSATSFPQVILSAASFNPSLWYRIGVAIGDEARALYNAGQAQGMTFWAPNINVFRDPRWGRGQETPGEDPGMASKYAVSYVRGLQGDSFAGDVSAEHLKASACCKHFTAYDLENWHGQTRYTFDAQVSAQDLADTYQPPFQSCVEEGKASGIMCSYNKVNGVPTCADYGLLSGTARNAWGFNGYITSDCDAVSIIHDAQGYAKTPEDAVADVLKAGMDVNCGKYLQNYTKSAVQQGKVSVGNIDRALHNLFSIRMRLGLFNGNPRQHRFGHIATSDVCSSKHQFLALEVAHDGIVLLKNSANLLPLSKASTGSLAVIGPNANSPSVLLGNYHGPPCESVSPLQALQSRAMNTHYLAGCDSVACGTASIGEAVGLAKAVDYVVLIMGLDQTQEKEEHDRVSLLLPGMQQSLITSVANAAKRPVILVLLSGGPVDVTFAKYNPKIGAILWGGYPGQAGGVALAEVIFGEHNPGGRLPVTWYPESFTKVPMTDMRMRPDPASGFPGRTYRFYNGPVVFKFGYGLSYSNYAYEFISVTRNQVYLNKSDSLYAVEKSGSIRYNAAKMGSDACENLRFSAVVGVKNNGSMQGRHPVLLFLRWPDVRRGSPLKKLVGFESVHLKAGERAEVEFNLRPCEHLSRVDEDGMHMLDVGSHFLLVGDEKHELTVLA